MITTDGLKRLVIGIVERAWQDRLSENRVLVADVLAWASTNPPEPFNLAFCCQVLDVDFDYVQSKFAQPKLGQSWPYRPRS